MKSGAISISDYMILHAQVSIAYSNITEASKNDVLEKFIF